VVHDVVSAGREDVLGGPVPAAVATAVFWVGLEAVFSAVFSGMVIANDDKYGPIGIMFSCCPG
jgi:hypothetical protein